MKYKEFKEKIEAWGRTCGYVTEVIIGKFETYIYIDTGINEELSTVASISNKFQCVIDTSWMYFYETKGHAKVELFSILVEFAKTPPEDREDEKEY